MNTRIIVDHDPEQPGRLAALLEQQCPACGHWDLVDAAFDLPGPADATGIYTDPDTVTTAVLRDAIRTLTNAA